MVLKYGRDSRQWSRRIPEANRRESQWQGIGALIVGLSSGEREAPNDAAHEAGAGSAGDGSAQRAGGWPDGPSGGHGVRGGPDGQPDIGGKPGSGGVEGEHA